MMTSDDGPRPSKTLQRCAVRLLNRWLATSFGMACFCFLLAVALLSSMFVVFDLAVSGRLPSLTTQTAVYLHRPVCSSNDNIGGESLGLQRCAEAIDVVYTWVNGSDPVWYQQMSEFKHRELMRRKYGEDWEQLLDTEAPDVRGANAKTGSANRYRDNNELRYSLRSLVKYAPWVRRVFIVTANQVPAWLNLADDRVQIITHDMIFSNKSHLPTFSSPAIEANLHRIPGLSNRFIYFNDDVFLGAPTMPDDFFTSVGQKVFWAWDAPRCNDGCIENWLGDGSCDQACNVSRCDWDAGECIGVAPAAAREQTSGSGYTQTAATHKYCSTGCSQSWLGDNVCDNKCDNKECGFDAIDCGVTALWEALPGFGTGVGGSASATAPDGSLPFLRSVLFRANGGVVVNVSLNDANVYHHAIASNSTSSLHAAQVGQADPRSGNRSGSVPAVAEAGEGEHGPELAASKSVSVAQLPAKPPDDVGSGHRLSQVSGTGALIFEMAHYENAVYFNLSAHFPPGNSTVEGASVWNEPDGNMCPGRVEDDVISAVLSQEYKVLTVVFDAASPTEECTGGSSLINFEVRGRVDARVFNPAAVMLSGAAVEVENAPTTEAPGRIIVRKTDDTGNSGDPVESPEDADGKDQQQDADSQVAVNLRFVLRRYFDADFAAAKARREAEEEAARVANEAAEAAQAAEEAEAAAQAQAAQDERCKWVVRDAMRGRMAVDVESTAFCRQFDLIDAEVLLEEEDEEEEEEDDDSSGGPVNLATGCTTTATVMSLLDCSQQCEVQRDFSATTGNGSDAGVPEPNGFLFVFDGTDNSGTHHASGVTNVSRAALPSTTLAPDSHSGVSTVPKMHDSGAGQGSPSILAQAAAMLLGRSKAIRPPPPLAEVDGKSAGFCCCQRAASEAVPAAPAVLVANSTNDDDSDSVNSTVTQATAAGTAKREGGPSMQQSLRWRLVFTQRGLRTWQQHATGQNSSSGNTSGMPEQESSEASDEEDAEPPIDHYKHSLIKVNMLYNKAFGNTKRKVPAHMPHMLQRSELEALQGRYPREFAATSSHRFRHSDDMQFAFAYFHWLVHNQQIGGKNDVGLAKLIDYWHRELDTDGDGHISDNEFLSVVGIALGHAPTEGELERVRDCVAPETTFTTAWSVAGERRRAIISSRPQITLARLANCSEFLEGVALHARPNLGEGVEEGDVSEVGFHMISDKTEETLEKLADVRAKRPKFVCVNDDMDNPSAELLRALQDFYESFFPHASRFELPNGQLNPPPLQFTALRPKVMAKGFWQDTTDWLGVIAIGSVLLGVALKVLRTS